MSALAALLRARHPGARIVEDGEPLHAVLEIGGGWHSARIRSAPMAEIYIGLPALDGFALTIEDATSGWPWSHGDVPFDPRYRVTTNDPALAGCWLDRDAARAIVAQRYQAATLSSVRGIALPTLVRAPMIERGWRFEIAGGESRPLRAMTGESAVRGGFPSGELAVLKGAAEADLERLHDALLAGGIVAASSHRLAAAWRRIASALGGACTSDRWDAGGEFAIACERGGASVRVAHLRRRAGEPPAEFRLRTVVAAPRVTPYDDALVVWRRGAPAQPRRAARKLAPLPLPGLGGHAARASDLPLAALRLDGRVRALVVESALDALELDAREVSVWFDGSVDDAARLGAAIDLCAQLAIDGGTADGPYR